MALADMVETHADAVGDASLGASADARAPPAMASPMLPELPVKMPPLSSPETEAETQETPVTATTTTTTPLKPAAEERQNSSSVSHTHSQSRSTVGRRVQQRLRVRAATSPRHAGGGSDGARRLPRLDAFAHAELLVLQTLVVHALRRESSDAALLVPSHPFLTRQREALAAVVSRADPLGASLTRGLETASSAPRDDRDAAAAPLKKTLFMDYPAWRKKYFQRSVDQRLRLKKSAFGRLFPALVDVPHAAKKRIFALFDRNGSGKVEFSELCESLARCMGRRSQAAAHRDDWADDERVAMVFEWFMEKYEPKLTSHGLGQLDAAVRAIQMHYKLPRDAKPLGEQLLAGKAALTFDEFYDRVRRLPQVVEVLMRPFDVLTPLVGEKELLQLHETTQWCVGDAAYVVDAAWWNRWVDHARGSGSRASPVDEGNSNQHESSGVGPIANESLCDTELDGVLKPNLRLREDFVVVASSVWCKLQLLYGGGPAIPRKTIAQREQAAPVGVEDDDEQRGSQLAAGIDTFDQDDDSVALNDQLRVHLYPLVLYIRLMKSDSIQTSLLMARQFMLSETTKLRDLLLRIGLVPGVNIQSMSLWMRRHRWDVWRRIECSLDAPRSSLYHVGLCSGHELIIDFKAFDTASSSSKKPQVFADNRLVISLYHPTGNDFVCPEPGLDGAINSDWNAHRADPTDEDGSAYEQKENADDRTGELYAGGHSGLVGNNTGFSFSISDQLKFTKKPLPRLIASGPNAQVRGGGIRATGLVNMGNTCFLNCALQCVGHSPVLREYFLSQRFLGDINKVNKLGTKGKIATAYGRLMDVLWSQLKDTQSCFAPAGFRDEFARHRTQFQESSQHDAHEFIVSLLDSLHEDLNRRRGGPSAKTKGGLFCLPFYDSRSSASGWDEDDIVASSAIAIEDDSTAGSSDELIGASAWQAHSRVNSSVIVDLFHGQMRSETVCSSCDERKATFDPFLFFSVPIPEPKFLRVEVKVMLQVRPAPSDPSSLESFPPTRQGFWLARNSTIADLCNEIAQEFGLEAKRFVVVEVRRNRIKRIFDECDALEAVTPFRDLYAFERAWSMGDIPVIPTYMADAFGQLADAEETTRAKDDEVVGFADLRIGTRVDGVGFHNDWHPGSVVGISEGEEPTVAAAAASRVARSSKVMRVQVHFDAFSSKWDKWFSAKDWNGGNLQPVHTKTTRSIEVFEVQVVHRRLIPFQRATYANSTAVRPGGASQVDGSSMLEIFGVPMFVTIASNRTAHELHGAILLQASRFIQGFSGTANEGIESVPYETRVVDLDDVGSVLGVPLPADSSCVLQHFATQSVIVLDWKNSTYADSEQQQKDRIPEEMAALEREHSRTKSSESILSNSTSLDACLDALFKAEDISLDDHWVCERCGVKRAGTRRSDVWKLPDLVMIQLKRFQYQENGYRQKVRTMVDFPLHGLDFSQWMGREGSGNLGSADPSCVYDLYAVANHVGGLARGHYTSYCKYDKDFEESARIFSPLERDRHHRGGAAEVQFDDVWYRFDDEKVVEIAPTDIATEAAYVLFYKRRKLSPHNVLAYAM